MRNFSALLLITVLLALASSASGQGTELSRADRLAMLYTSQLSFSGEGDPLIRIGLADGLDEVRFSADGEFVIQPLGHDGVEIFVPADVEMRVRLVDGEPGIYSYAAVVAELAPSERAALNDVRELWESRGFNVTSAEVGAIFAVAGQRFDTRRTLVLIGDDLEREPVAALVDQLAADWGIDARIHAELSDYPGGTVVLDGLPGGVRIENDDLLWVRGDADTVFTVEDVPFDVGTRNEGIETRRYVGSLVFTADHDGRLTVVNETTLERLLRGIVPAEIYTSAPEEALMAQAIAARSDLLSDLGARYLADPYMTCSDQRCQVYRGVGHENSATTAAVNATRGMVLVDGDRIIRAYYSSNNGGFSASNAETWGDPERGYLAAHFDGLESTERFGGGLADEAVVAEFLADPPDAWSAISSFASGSAFRWSTTMTGREASIAVGRAREVGPLLDIEVVERSFSGRITRLRVAGTEGEAVIERELNIRRAFGGLRSALFVFDVEHGPDGLIESITFNGAGFGHGVGLCQSGAIGAAERGYAHDAILANYYPGTELRRLY